MDTYPQEKEHRPKKLPDWPEATVPPLQLAGLVGWEGLVGLLGGVLVGEAGGLAGTDGLVPREG